MTYTQDDRHIKVITPLGKDILLLERFSGTETLSAPFRFELVMASENRAIDFSLIVGKNVTVAVEIRKNWRYFNGIVSRFWQESSDDTFTYYRAEVVPWLWLLTLTANCRIFQNKTIPDIIEDVFKKRGFQAFKKALTKTYQPREYCVQYRETDFNFVSRLMEQYGIHYYFEHVNGKHALVIADSNSPHEPVAFQPQVRYQRSTDAVVLDKDVIVGWVPAHSVRTGKYTLTDYNWQTPSVNLQVTIDGMSNFKGEIYDYPGGYLKKADGDAIAKLRIQAEEATMVEVEGAGCCRDFAAGSNFTLTDHPRTDQNKTWLLTSVYHDMREEGFRSGGQAEFSYSNRFACIPLDRPYLPPRRTPRPLISGAQTALVVGKKGEEIWVDKHGRIVVQFYWDREGKKDENSSCWIRVAQAWAGKRWGALFLPRIGQEVVVEFLEGDPDFPIVTGSVYNGELMPPYDLPGQQTRSTTKSNSSKGGGGFNEIRFEDKKGSEQVYIHSQKDMDLVIEDTSRERVEKDRHLKVGQNRIEEIGADAHLKIVGAAVSDIGGNASHKFGGDLVEEISGSQSSKVGMELNLKAGMKVVVDAGMEITLKAAGGFVKIDPMGVTISGNLVLINSGGAASPASTKPPKSPKPPAKADSEPK